jgi:hypothetical protein
MGEQPERGLVGPVHVVEHEREGLAFRGGAQDGHHAFEQREAGLLGVRAGGRAALPVPGERRQRAPVPVVDRWRRRHVLAVGLEQRSQRLAPRPVSRRPAALRAASPEDPRGGRGQPARELLHETRLADARLAGDGERSAVSGTGLAEARREQLELALPPDELRLAWPLGDHRWDGGGGRSPAPRADERPAERAARRLRRNRAVLPSRGGGSLRSSAIGSPK